MWLTSIAGAFKINAVLVSCEDKNGTPIQLSLYNQVATQTSPTNIREMFPLGQKLGVKNPYLKLNAVGNFSLRNDNPINIVLQNETQNDHTKLKQQGNKFFSDNLFSKAIYTY